MVNYLRHLILNVYMVAYDRENANDVKAKFVVEAANHPTDPDADEVPQLFLLPFQYRYPVCFSSIS